MKHLALLACSAPILALAAPAEAQWRSFAFEQWMQETYPTIHRGTISTPNSDIDYRSRSYGNRTTTEYTDRYGNSVTCTTRSYGYTSRTICD